MAEEIMETSVKTDEQLIIDAMARFGEGDFSAVDTASFSDPVMAVAFNNMVNSVAERNNQFLARINDAMSRIGDNHNMKMVLDHLESQKDSLKILKDTRSTLSFSMKQVEESCLEMLALSRQVRNGYEPCAEDLSLGCEAVDGSIEQLRDVVRKIKEKFDSMGYAGPEKTRAINSFVSTMQRFTDIVASKKEEVRQTVEDMEALKGRIEQIISDVLLITATVEKQNASSKSFLESVDKLAGCYENLSVGAYDTGRQLYRISRDIDNARNDIFRHNSRPTIHDTLRVYEVDHLVLSWRVYNHLMELETLKITQLNNPDRCKYGLWCANMQDPDVLASDGFRHAFDAHEELHKHAVASFMAKEDYDMGLARKEAAKTLEAFDRFQLGLEELHAFYLRQGIPDETPLWKFK